MNAVGESKALANSSAREQINAVMSSISNAKGSWAGTLLPARIAATVQRLADANFPLRLDQAQALATFPVGPRYHPRSWHKLHSAATAERRSHAVSVSRAHGRQNSSGLNLATVRPSN
jgi:hypothetical protein